MQRHRKKPRLAPRRSRNRTGKKGASYFLLLIEGVFTFAFLTFDASAVGATDVGFVADAAGRAFSFGASGRQCRISVNQERQRRAAAGQTVQLCAAFDVRFAIAGAFAGFDDGCGGQDESGRSRSSAAVGRGDADALSVFQESFLAKAADDAIASADRTRVRIGARGRASRTARMEFLVRAAFGNWRKHSERLDSLSVAFAGFDTFAFFRTEMSFLAGATGFANARAKRIRILARAIATFAFTVFFVFTALLRGGFEHDERLGLDLLSSALTGLDAFAFFRT